MHAIEKILAKNAGVPSVKCGQIVTLDKPLMGVHGDYLVERVAWHCRGGLTSTQLGVVGL